jgi:hypothetical protein
MPILRWALANVISWRERDNGIRKLALGILTGRSVKSTGVNSIQIKRAFAYRIKDCH